MPRQNEIEIKFRIEDMKALQRKLRGGVSGARRLPPQRTSFPDQHHKR
jgi:hypothetical protein